MRDIEEALSPDGDAGSLTPGDVVNLAEAARTYVHRAVGVELDSSPETLPVLDHYVSLVRESARERPELLPLVAPPIAAYFGALACDQLNAFWHGAAERPEHWLVCGRSVLLAFSPLGVVHDVLYRGVEHEGPSAELMLLPAHREAVLQRLAALPGVRQDEYYMLATRFEVIELAADEVRRLMGEREGEQGGLEWGDYAALLGRPGASA